VKILRFSVPLLRFVIPIDRLEAGKPAKAKRVRQQTPLMHKSPSIPMQTLLRLIRIETPLETLLPNKPKPSPTVPPSRTEPTPLARARKKANPKSKVSRTRRRPRRNKK
jgi:hypothetical protein